MSKTRRAVLSIGSNQGDALGFLGYCRIRMGQHPEISLTNYSEIWLTPPWGGVEQAWFYNQCLAISTTLEPLELLDFCQQIEQECHRERKVHWGPRTLDVDIVWMQDVELTTSRLTIPHPYAAQRAFVLVPWLQVDPNAKLNGVSCTELVRAVKQDVQQMQRYPAPPVLGAGGGGS